MYDLEKKGGSIIGGVFKLIQARCHAMSRHAPKGALARAAWPLPSWGAAATHTSAALTRCSPETPAHPPTPQERKANPPPERSPALPPKPAGQTVGSFRRGLRTLPDAMAAKLGGAVRTSWALQGIAKEGDLYK